MFLVNKQVKVCTDGEGFESIDWSREVQIPMGTTHPGAFGFERTHHIHEGVDIYTCENELIYLPECLWVVGWIDFTGAVVGSPWWNETKALVCHTPCEKTIILGEIMPTDNGIPLDCSSGWYEEGTCIGRVHPVLKKDKGRPRHMVHIEMYSQRQNSSVGLWKKGCQKPEHLIDPTSWLLRWGEVDLSVLGTKD